METFHSTFLGYRIYRRKLLGTAAMVFLLTLAALGGLYAFFMNTWLTEEMRKVQEQFLEGEKRLKNVEILTEEFVDEMYGNRALMQDMTAFLEAVGEQEYLNTRRNHSLGSQQQIAYLPGSLKRLFQTNQGSVSGVLIYGSGGLKAIWQEAGSGDMKVSFALSTADEKSAIAGFGNMLAAAYDIRDSRYLNRNIGRIEFYVNSDGLYETRDSQVESWRLTEDGEILEESLLGEKADSWLEEAADREEEEGWISRGGWKRVYFMKLNSTQGNYDYTVVIDKLELLKKNGTAMLTIVITLFLFAGGAMAISFAGIRDDSDFLRTIMQILRALEVGNFEEIHKRKLPRQHRQNEYGMIAVALKDVGLKMEEYIRQEYVLKLKEQETAMRALQHQINPHFLYNTLETIRSSALVNSDRKTADAIALLGSLYRARMHKTQTISLKEEFELLEMYLQIMQLRFGDSFLYQIELDREAEQVATVNFWMQPLAENFFTHGFDRESEFNLLVVNGYLEEDGIRIDIIDNGKGIEPDKIESILKNMYEGNDDPEADIGLRNVYMRLKYFYGEEFRMEIGNNAEGGVGIVIHIPGKAGTECIR